MILYILCLPGESDKGVPVEGEEDPNEEEDNPDEEEDNPDAMITISAEEESGSLCPDDMNEHKLSIVNEVKESFCYWQYKDAETNTNGILHILRQYFRKVKRKEAHIT